MKRIGEVLNNSRSTRFEQKILDTKLCPHGNVTLELRETTKHLPDGTKETEKQWTECLCQKAREAQKEQVEKRLMKYEKYTTHNLALENATLENFELEEANSSTQGKAFVKSMQFVQSFRPGNGHKLYFHGDVGAGKSHLAIGIHKEVKELGYSSIYLEMDKIMRIIKDTWSKDGNETEGEFFRVLQEVDLLIIDDLGAENNTQWAQEKLFSILNSRLGKNTIITSNLSIDELEERYTHRIVDRIYDGLEPEDYIKIEVKVSYRKRKYYRDKAARQSYGDRQR